jgi:hypothetical protein
MPRGRTGVPVSEADVTPPKSPPPTSPPPTSPAVSPPASPASLSAPPSPSAPASSPPSSENSDWATRLPAKAPREATERGAAHAAEHPPAATEGSLYRAGPVRLRAGGHPGERARIVASGALMFGHGRAQLAQRHAPLLGLQLGEGFLMGLLDRVRRGDPHQVAVALERLLVCEFARGGRRGRGSVLPGPRFGPGTAAKETIQKSHGADVPGWVCRVRVT